MDRFVTIAVFTLPQELAVVRARLEWEGIPCFTQDENTVSAHPFYSNLVGGIKLQVAAEDAEEALAILKESAHRGAAHEDAGTTAEELSDAGPLIRWPTLSREKAFLIAMVLLGLVVLTLILLA